MLETLPYGDDDISECFRVDLLITNSEDERALVEIQNNNEYAYYQRTIFGLSKSLTEYINRGEGYEHVRKVYSVNIVYFSLGMGVEQIMQARG